TDLEQESPEQPFLIGSDNLEPDGQGVHELDKARIKEWDPHLQVFLQRGTIALHENVLGQVGELVGQHTPLDLVEVGPGVSVDQEPRAVVDCGSVAGDQPGATAKRGEK